MQEGTLTSLTLILSISQHGGSLTVIDVTN